MPNSSAELYMNNRRYGQGLDSTLRVRNDEPFCESIHGAVAGPDCHLDGMPPPWTTIGCEMALLGGTIGKPVACPVWQYRAAGVVGSCVDDQDAPLSCDHMGSAGGPLDDPKTPTTGDTVATLRGFEGAPPECGLQRDKHGPIAGPFTIAHGAGEIRSCLPNGQGCGPWVAVDH